MTSSRITLTEAITALVTEKRAVGFKYVAEERVLTRFAAFCRTEFGELDAPTQASVEAWIAAAGRRGVRPGGRPGRSYQGNRRRPGGTVGFTAWERGQRPRDHKDAGPLRALVGRPGGRPRRHRTAAGGGQARSLEQLGGLGLLV